MRAKWKHMGMKYVLYKIRIQSVRGKNLHRHKVTDLCHLIKSFPNIISLGIFPFFPSHSKTASFTLAPNNSSQYFLSGSLSLVEGKVQFWCFIVLHLLPHLLHLQPRANCARGQRDEILHNHQLLTPDWRNCQNAAFNKCYLRAPEVVQRLWNVGS